MKIDKTTTWSSGGVGGKSTGSAAGGGVDGPGKLPVQPGSNTSSKVSIGTDSFTSTSTTSTSTKIRLR